MPAGSFDHIERNVAGHFRLNFYAAVYHLVHALRRLANENGTAFETTLRAHGFLARYLEQILPHIPDELSWEEMLAWWRREISDWENDASAELPLVALDREGSVGFTGRLALMIVALGEEDSRFGTLFGALQSPLATRRPSLELIGQMLKNGHADAGADGWSICRDLLGAGLIEVANPEAPRSEWAIKLPTLVWRMIRGERDGDLLPGCRLIPAETFPLLGDLILDEELLARLARLPALIQDSRIRIVVVKGMPGSDQLQVIGSVARTLGRGIAVITGLAEKPGNGADSGTANRPLLGPLCIMGRYLPVFVYDLNPGETADVPAIPGYAGPLGVVLGLEGGIGAARTEGALTISLPLLSAEQRRRCWRRALNNHIGAEFEELSERFLLPAGHVRQAAGMAIRHAALDRRDTVEIRDVREACRALNRQMLDTHAALLEGGGGWHDLVVSAATAVRLRDLELRCRHRERLLQHLGSAFATNSNRGVRALLTGASGTGKTLAAKIIAAELGIDLYRVDLGAVVNKYIGETEKNLHQVLSRAEALDVILLLDEGDALLGNRTEVKTANDRYANLETNYLLQRLETYQGIVIVTTNAAQHIDRAFQRRMDVVVSFVHPQPEERRAIWHLHLPQQHAIGGDFFDEVVRRCALTGGQIRNAALHATLLALEEGSGVVRALHLEAALRGEYRKAGATCPLDGGDTVVRARGMAAFVEVMRS
jgi:hypothetical protein